MYRIDTTSLSKFFKAARKSAPSVADHHLYAKTGLALLAKPERQQCLSKIKRLLSVTDTVWHNHYYYAIARFSELVQSAPASEFHHHNYEGGLIDHTLEALHIGIKVSLGFVIPPNTTPESLAGSTDKWRFGVFIAILAHDVGKILTDMEFIYKINNDFVRWSPWSERMPIGAHYLVRYKKRAENTATAKSLHEKAAIGLLPQLLTKEASLWLMSDPELFAQVLSTISNAAFGGDVIAKITQIADRSSVAESVGGEGGSHYHQHIEKVPLHEKLMTSLMKLANDGTLKRNRPGACIWITENYTWVVSKAGMEAIREQLLEEGHSGIPRSVVRLFGVLNENNCLVKTITGDSVWKAQVNDFAHNWQQTLTFLKFDNAVIWPTHQPPVFDGEVTAEEKGNVPTATAAIIDGAGQGETKTITPKIKTIRQIKKKMDGQQNQATSSVKTILAEPEKALVSTVNPMAIDFFVWLIADIKKLKLRVNEPKSPLHFTADYLLLVTPSIFLKYLKSNPLKMAIYSAKAGNKKPYTALQREVESLAIHKHDQSGSNIVTALITGYRTSSQLSCYALQRAYFPELANFSANNAISIQ